VYLEDLQLLIGSWGQHSFLECHVVGGGVLCVQTNVFTIDDRCGVKLKLEVVVCSALSNERHLCFNVCVSAEVESRHEADHLVEVSQVTDYILVWKASSRSSRIALLYSILNSFGIF
jgi:hypothetical protein